MANDDLHPYFERLIQAVDDVKNELVKVKREIVKLPEILQEGFQLVADAIHKNTRAQAELKLMEHMSEVHSILPQIDAERQQIEAEKDELDEQLASIDERYASKHRELDEKAEERIRNLGEHIFRIDEAEFEAGIEEPFTDHVTTTWSELRQHNERVRERRHDDLQSSLSAVEDEISSFISKRESILDRIDGLRVGLFEDLDEPTTLEVPFWVVTVERDGVEETTLVAPSRMTTDDSGWYGVELSPLPGVEKPVERVAATRPANTATSRVRKADLRRVAEEYGSEGLFGQLSYAEAFEAAVADGVRVETETGGE